MILSAMVLSSIQHSVTNSVSNSVSKIRLENLPVRLHVLGWPFREHLALDHANHVRAELHDEVHVVLDDDEATALRLVELDEAVVQLVDQARVHAGTRLVEQDQPRGRHEGHRDVDQLLLAVGKAARGQMRDVPQAEQLDHLVSVVAQPGVGLREQAPGHCALELLRRGDQVVADRKLDEHLQGLERAADATARQLEGRHARNVFAAEFDGACGRADLAENAVEKRRLAGAVGTNDSNDLARSYGEADAVDGLDRPVVLADVLHLEEARARGHLAAPVFLKRSPIESNPPGRKTIITMIAKPKMARYQFCMNRSSSGRRITTTVPSTGPKKRPEPPTITASSIISETERWNCPGSMKFTSAARYTPPMPAQAAPIANASSV